MSLPYQADRLEPHMKLCLILGDQLSPTLSSLTGLDPQNDIILMCEVRSEATYVKHHKKKIAFVFFCDALFCKGIIWRRI